MHDGFADFCKESSKAVGRRKSKAKVIKAKVNKVAEAKKCNEAKLHKENEPQLATRPGAMPRRMLNTKAATTWRKDLSLR